jgi:hypothetical protein
MAENWVVVPGAITGVAGEIAIEVSVTDGPGTMPPPPLPEHAANRVANKRIIIIKPGPCFMIFS